MDSRVGSEVVLFQIFLIGLTFTFVDAALPNDDLRVAASCLRTFFGEIPLKNSFLDPNDSLTLGEYIGGFCSGLSPGKVDKKIKKHGDGGDYDAIEIKKCLQLKNREACFEKYCKLGADYEAKLSKQDSESVPSPGIVQKVPSVLAESSDKVGLKQVLLNAPSAGEFKTLQNSQIFKFIEGVCTSDDLADFELLYEEKDKKETLKCLGTCASNLFNRIEYVIEAAKIETIKILGEKFSQVNGNTSLPPGISDADLPKFLADEESLKKTLKGQIDKLENKTQINKPASTFGIKETKNATGGIKRITSAGKDYLYDYGEYYNNVDECLEGEDEQLGETVANLDMNLFSIFSTYKDCAIRGCGMKPPNSVPFYQLVEDGSKDPDPSARKISVEGLKALAELLYKPKYRKFFKVLWSGQNTINVNGANSDSK